MSDQERIKELEARVKELEAKLEALTPKPAKCGHCGGSGEVAWEGTCYYCAGKGICDYCGGLGGSCSYCGRNYTRY